MLQYHFVGKGNPLAIVLLLHNNYYTICLLSSALRKPPANITVSMNLTDSGEYPL